MPKLYYKKPISKKERFQNAIVIGVATTLVSILILFIVHRIMGIYLPLIYLLAGYLMGLLVSRFSHGTQKSIAFLALGLTVVVIIVGDLLYFGSVRTILLYWSSVSSSYDVIWEVIYRVGAGYLAYTSTRV